MGVVELDCPEMSSARGDSVELEDAPSSPLSQHVVRDCLMEEAGVESESEESVQDDTLQFGKTVLDMQIGDGAQTTTIRTDSTREVQAPSQQSMQGQFEMTESTLPSTPDGGDLGI